LTARAAWFDTILSFNQTLARPGADSLI